MLGVEEPIHLRRASLVSEIYSEANDPLTAELTARGRRKKSSSTGIADFGKLFEWNPKILCHAYDNRKLDKLIYNYGCLLTLIKSQI